MSLSIACIAQCLVDFGFFYFCLIRHHESLNRLYCPVSVRFSFFFLFLYDSPPLSFATISLSIACIPQFLFVFRFFLFLSGSPPLSFATMSLSIACIAQFLVDFRFFCFC